MDTFCSPRPIAGLRLELISARRTRSFLTHAARVGKRVSVTSFSGRSDRYSDTVGWRTNRFESYDRIWQSRDFRLIADDPWLRGSPWLRIMFDR